MVGSCVDSRVRQLQGSRVGKVGIVGSWVDSRVGQLQGGRVGKVGMVCSGACSRIRKVEQYSRQWQPVGQVELVEQIMVDGMVDMGQVVACRVGRAGRVGKALVITTSYLVFTGTHHYSPVLTTTLHYSPLLSTTHLYSPVLTTNAITIGTSEIR